MSPLRRTIRNLSIVLIPLIVIATVLVSYSPSRVGASSHREAPLISSDPDADGTDLYAFIPSDRNDSLTIVGSWIPFEAPEGGPNYNQFSPDVLYELHLDNVGDAKSHVTYQFRFTKTVQNPNTFLYNTGPITSLTDTDWNIRQTYTITEIVTPNVGSPTTRVLATNVPTPPSNIGSKSTPNYAALSNAAITTIGIGASNNVGNDGNPANDIKVFAGQTDDAFWVDLGSIFDLLTLRGQGPPVGYGTGITPGLDNLTGFNVHSIVLQVPISRLNGATSVLGNNPETVVGVWSTSSRQTTCVRGTFSVPSCSGNFVQISRLGMPLTNEVVIPLALKDAFNSLRPEDDAGIYVANNPTGNLLQKSVEDPELGTLLCALYGVPVPGDGNSDCHSNFNDAAPLTAGRTDIADIFLRGMKTAAPFTVIVGGTQVTVPAGTNVNQPATVTPAEMLRLNTAPAFRPGGVGSLCSTAPSRLGVLGGDVCGFPNGRRLADDIVEIELLAVAGAAYAVLTPNTFAFNPAFVQVLDDSVDFNDVPFRSTFPYMALPHQGQEHFHTNLHRTTVNMIFHKAGSTIGHQ